MGNRKALAGAALVLFTVASSAGARSISFPGRNGKLVVDNRGIVVVNPDGSGLRRFSRNDDDTGPAWSPTGTEIAFARDPAFHRGEIVVTTPDGAGRRRLLQAPRNGFAFSPTWSPDGKQIAYYQEADDENLSGIFVIGIDGRGRRKVTEHGYTDTDPAWSPDGRAIAFSALEQGSKEIHVVRPDGTGRRKVADGYRPSWSPDGRSLVYVVEQDRFVTYAVNPDGTGRHMISRPPSEDQDASAAWSPDGRSIAISRLVDERPGIPRGGYRVYLVNADGTNLRRIPVNGFSVDWQRVTGAAPSFSDARRPADGLDLARLAVRMAGDRVETTIETWKPLPASALRRGSLTVLYDTNFDGEADETLRLQPGSVSRRSATSVTFARRLRRGGVRVAVMSRWRNRGRCRHGCRDRIPDSGWLTAREP